MHAGCTVCPAVSGPGITSATGDGHNRRDITDREGACGSVPGAMYIVFGVHGYLCVQWWICAFVNVCVHVCVCVCVHACVCVQLVHSISLQYFTCTLVLCTNQHVHTYLHFFFPCVYAQVLPIGGIRTLAVSDSVIVQSHVTHVIMYAYIHTGHS